MFSIVRVLQAQDQNLNHGLPRNKCLLIFRVFILDSRVDAGMPSRAAAPSGPAIRPRVSFKTASICAFCCSRVLDDSESGSSELFCESFVTVPGSNRKTSLSARITQRSITF